MLSHRLDSPLAKAIKNHTPDMLITALKSAPHIQAVNTADSAKLTPLQRTASTGMTEGLLWLLNAHAIVDAAVEASADTHPLREYHKTPLYLALEHHHELNVQILLLCGADKEKTYALAEHNKDRNIMDALERLHIKPKLIDHLLQWAVSHYCLHYGFHLIHAINETLKKLSIRLSSRQPQSFSLSAQPSLSLEDPADLNQQVEHTLQRLIEFTLSKNQPELALYLINMTAGKILPLTHTPSAGFWVATHNIASADIRDKINNSAMLSVKTLQDIEASGKKDLLTSKMTHTHLDHVNLYIETPKPSIKPHGLTTRQVKIYRSVLFADSAHDALLKKFSSVMTTDCLAVLTYCVKEKNYVSFHFLKSYLSSELVFQHALTTQDADLLMAYSFCDNHFMYEIANLYPQKANIALSLLREEYGLDEIDGVSFRMVSHGISGYTELRNPMLVEKHKQFFHHYEITAEIFLRLYFHALYHRNDVSHFKQAASILHSNNASDFIEHAARFGFDFTHRFQASYEKTNKLDIKTLHRNPSISKNILDLLDQRSLARFSTLSKSHHLVYTETQLAVFEETSQHLMIELKKLPFFKNRNYRDLTNANKKTLFCLGSLLIADSIFSILLSTAVNRVKDIKLTMSHTQTEDGGSCDRFLDNNCLEVPNSQAICQSLCNDLDDNVLKHLIPFLILTILFSLTTLFFLPGTPSALKKLFLAFWDGLDRFNPMALTELPVDFQEELTHVFNQIQENTTEALHLSVQSSVTDAKNALAAQKDRSIVWQQRYAFFNAPLPMLPARVDIEEHKSDPIDDNEDDENLEMYSHSLLSYQRKVD